MSKKLRNDLLLAGGILLAATLFALIFFMTRQEGAYAAVIKDGREVARYSLAEAREVPLIANGETTNLLVIEGGKAFMREANCPDQICVKHRAISKVGETIVCLPNEIVIKIVDSGGDAPDMVV